MGKKAFFRLLVLDCDGVLIRSERANLAYYNHLFRAFGLPEVPESDRERVRRLHTLSTPQVIEAFFPPDLRARARQLAESVGYAPFVSMVEPEPGWHGVLAERPGFERVAVATNRGTSARAVLEAVGLLPLVDAVITVRDVTRPKPHPDMLLAAARRLGAEPGCSVYVGDAELDRTAARSAGMAFLGFRTRARPSIRHPGELPRALEALATPHASGTLPCGIAVS